MKELSAYAIVDRFGNIIFGKNNGDQGEFLQAEIYDNKKVTENVLETFYNKSDFFVKKIKFSYQISE